MVAATELPIDNNAKAGEMAQEVLGDGVQIVAGTAAYFGDGSVQPLRWAGQRTVPANGALTPIRIVANTFGHHEDLWVSPQHRVLIRDNLAQLLFGEDEGLVAAKEMVNDRSVARIAGGEVTYVYPMFDRHQVINSQHLDPQTGDGHGTAARPSLRSFERRFFSDRLKVA